MLKRAWAQADPRGEVAAALRPYRGRLRRVQVDKVGVGAYFAKHLQDLGYPVRGVNVGQAPRDRERLANLKAELYWGLRERCEKGDIGGLDDKAVAQLASIRYMLNARGQVVIESKEEMRKRGVRSPDHAEAILLALAEPRGGGLIELWREQAEALKRQGPVNCDPGRELAQAQKAEVDWMRTPLKTGQAVSRRRQPESCPGCGNEHMAAYTDVWRCGACGKSGAWEPQPCA